MSHKPTFVSVLQEGMAYTIRLKDGRKIDNAVYYACIASGKDNEVYPAEDVQSHSLIGHNVPDNYREEPDPDRVVITDDAGEVIEVVTTPTLNPEMFRRRVRGLMLSGLSPQEAKRSWLRHRRSWSFSMTSLSEPSPSMPRRSLYNDALCAVPAFQPGTCTKIPAGHERLAGHGVHGGRGTLERR